MSILIRGMLGALGVVAGVVISKLLDYTVFQIGNPDFNDIWLKYNTIIRYALALLGMSLGLFAMRRGNGKVQLKNLQSSVVIDVRIGFSWTTFFFGFFPALFRGDIKWAAIMFIVNFITLGLGWLVFPFIYNKIFLKGLLSHGFVPVDESNKKILQDIGIVFA